MKASDYKKLIQGIATTRDQGDQSERQKISGSGRKRKQLGDTCTNGHVYTEKSMAIRKKDGATYCRICASNATRKWIAKKKGGDDGKERAKNEASNEEHTQKV